ncbi:cobalt-precorrin 5A hydrolase [Geomonas subterranea]|uniref:Cobalt-precorrin 5A hydrolase n=1 Tax=Geomonas subterranea TaxID=2847989 RepID=A0ABX8LEL9_9BACT|nr:cobalt-precorrin 5A hydrolase [Geomonas subterranea]QXE90498.1 cobalt-precorrin 5A hydrolase [Geomonas subterranea]QXM11425.1 cobalt-precorrin 5A hydrolase [Geomonas subterranea]
MRVAIIAITANGAKLGAALKRGLPQGTLFVLEKHATTDAVPFSERVPALMARLWPDYDGLVCIMATGIVVRSIASLLKGKDRDPAVVVMDDAGRFAISLLSGHLGGANALAAQCADVTGATAVITTATDVNDLPSFDMLAHENGWRIEDLSRVKVLNARLLEGREIAVVDPTGKVADYCGGRGKLLFLSDLDQAAPSGASGRVVVTNRVLPSGLDLERTLVLRPVDLCLGIGCNRGTTAEEIEAVVSRHLGQISLSERSINCLASAQAKGDEVGLLAYAEKKGIPLVLFSSDELNGVEVPSPPSEHAFNAIGARGVAEPAALLASSGGRLLLNKVRDGNVTLAVAQLAVV